MNRFDGDMGQDEARSAPVFAGLTDTGITGRDIAKALRVSPATVSKWRRGHALIPQEIQIFLTLMLADQVRRLADLYAEWRPASAAWHLHARAGLDVASEALALQEQHNRKLPGSAVCNGARLFRIWWNADRIVSNLAAKPAPLVRQAALASGI